MSDIDSINARPTIIYRNETVYSTSLCMTSQVVRYYFRHLIFRVDIYWIPGIIHYNLDIPN